MSNALKNLWPYLLALAILFAVAWWGDSLWPGSDIESQQIPETHDTMGKPEIMEVDTVQKERAFEMDTAPVTDVKQRLWHVVISSVKERESAEKYAATLAVDEVKVHYVEYLDTYRVVYGSFASIRGAQEAYREIEGRYPEAWLVYF